MVLMVGGICRMLCLPKDVIFFCVAVYFFVCRFFFFRFLSLVVYTFKPFQIGITGYKTHRRGNNRDKPILKIFERKFETKTERKFFFLSRISPKN